MIDIDYLKMYPNNSDVERFSSCRNCKADTYDPGFKDILDFLNGRKPRHLATIYGNNISQYELERKKLEDISKYYRIQRCVHNTDHLWRKNKKVLMVAESYEFVRFLHRNEDN